MIIGRMLHWPVAVYCNDQWPCCSGHVENVVPTKHSGQVVGARSDLQSEIIGELSGKFRFDLCDNSRMGASGGMVKSWPRCTREGRASIQFVRQVSIQTMPAGSSVHLAEAVGE